MPLNPGVKKRGDNKQVLYYRSLAKQRDSKTGGWIDVWYKTTLNMSALHRLALKAHGNKSKRARLGPIEVEVIGA